MSTSDWLRTDIGTTTADAITVRGHDLAGELMGRVTFTELAFLLVQGRMPEPGETVLLDAVLVSLADHGLTPTVLAARLTHTGAPESLQGAVAAGLLAPFKVPRYMEAAAELPHTPTGRVAKHELTRERTPAEIDFERRA